MIDFDKIVEDVESVEVEDAEQLEGYTPYQIAKVINAILRKLRIASERGSEDLYQVPPQMMYQYAKAGRINGVKGSKRYSEEDVEKFVAKFVANARARNGSLEA